MCINQTHTQKKATQKLNQANKKLNLHTKNPQKLSADFQTFKSTFSFFPNSN